MPLPYEDDITPVEGGSNAIRDADRALFPDGSNIIHLLMKGRGNPVVKTQTDHIMSMMIRRGRLNSALGINGDTLNAGEADIVADAINSYGMNGEARDEIIETLSALPTMQRRPNHGRNGSDEGFGP